MSERERDVVSRKWYYEKLGQIEEKLGKPVREMTFEEMMTVDANLVKVKVLDTLMWGAEQNAVGRQVVNVVPMDTEKEEVPTITADDFTVYAGAVPTEVISAGGKFGTVSLDVSAGKGTYRAALGIPQDWIDDKKFASMAICVQALGQAFAYDETKRFVAQMIADAPAANTQALGADNHYVGIVKCMGLIRKSGFNPDTIIINPGEEADLMALDKFIDARMLDREGAVVRTGQVGRLLSCDVFSTNACTAGTMVVEKREKGIVMGLRLDLEIVDYKDPLQGLVGAVARERYDYKTALAGLAIGKVTGA